MPNDTSMNRRALPIPDRPLSGDHLKLARRVNAVHLEEKSDGNLKMGLLTQLAPGTDLETCGEGCNHRTVRVRVGQESYFVFRQDLAGSFH